MLPDWADSSLAADERGNLIGDGSVHGACAGDLFLPADLVAPILRGAATSARQLCAADHGVAALAGPQERAPLLMAQAEGPCRVPRSAIRIAVRSVRAGAAVLAPDITDERFPQWRPAVDAGIRSLAAVPFRVGPSDGCLLVASESERWFSMTDVVQLRRLAEFTAVSQVRAARAGQRHLARDLHDVFGQELTALVFAIDRLDETLESPDQLDCARAVRQHALKAMSELRKLIGDTVAVSEQNQDWLGGISLLLEDLVGAGIVVHFSNVLGKERLPREIAACLYHVAHEALLNIRRHAKARTVHVTLWRQGRSVLLAVSDDGTGLCAAGRGGFGLTLMRERVEEVDGRLFVQSTPGKGTRINVALPCAGGRTY